jgi:hypothetical protein
VVANSLFIIGTDANFISRNWQKGTDKIANRKKETDGNTSHVKSNTHTVELGLKKSRQRKQGNHCARKGHLQRPWRISLQWFVMSVRVYTGDEKTY